MNWTKIWMNIFGTATLFGPGYGILGIIGRGTAYCHIDESYILGDEAQEKTASVCLNVTIDITIKE